MLWQSPLVALLACPPSRPWDENKSSLSRRNFGAITVGAGLFVAGPRTTHAATAAEVQVTLQSPRDRLGVELYATTIMGNRSVVAIKRVVDSQKNPSLQSGLVLQGYTSLQGLQERLQQGPYPVKLVFQNLAAGGDAISDTGAPLVTAPDALRLAQQQSSPTTPDATSYRVETLQDSPRQCTLQSRRNDLLEIHYKASFLRVDRNGNPVPIVYDSSAQRGTGQPYQMVLGSGDMLPGVDLGLYEACPGTRRRLTIPPRLAYGRKGNALYGIPPDTTLVWEVELVRLNGQDVDSTISRDELEERVPYTQSQ